MQKRSGYPKGTELTEYETERNKAIYKVRYMVSSLITAGIYSFAKVSIWWNSFLKMTIADNIGLYLHDNNLIEASYIFFAFNSQRR